MTRRIAVTGSSGLIGSALVSHLAARGDEVLRLVRRPPRTASEAQWDPATRYLDPAVLAGVSAVVNLAGAGVGDHRWTPAYKGSILTSRTDSTHTVAAAIAAADPGIRLVSGSAVGYYGDRGEEELTEDSTAGTGFLTDVVRAWEAAAGPAVEAGASVAYARTGLVLTARGGLALTVQGGPALTARGGALPPLLTLARLGILGPLGSGRQFWPWITLQDEVRALVHLVDSPEVTGPVNLVGPAPARQREVAAAVGTALHRPALVPAPAFAVRLALGEFAGDILASQRIVGERLVASGFSHLHRSLPEALDWALTDASAAAS